MNKVKKINQSMVLSNFDKESIKKHKRQLINKIKVEGYKRNNFKRRPLLIIRAIRFWEIEQWFNSFNPNNLDVSNSKRLIKEIARVMGLNVTITKNNKVKIQSFNVMDVWKEVYEH